MNALVFDTLKFTKHMVAAGMPAEQAEALAEEQAHLVNDQLATKRDIELIRRDIKELEAATKRDLKELEHRMTIKLGGMMVIAVGAVALLNKL